MATGTHILVLGGTGRVGSAAAIHLLSSDAVTGPMCVTIAGRSKRQAVAHEIIEACGGHAALKQRQRSLKAVQFDYKQKDMLQAALREVPYSAVVHTAGPYLHECPDVLQAAIESKVPVYADLSDPLEYLEDALTMDEDAKAAGTMAVVSAGAFPGLSNLIASDCAARLRSPVKDIQFSYFTAGLGGSGAINLLITNLGFGEPVWTLRMGKRRPQLHGGLDSRKIDFFFDSHDPSFSRVGKQTVWAWPFPEVCTVGETLRISGSTDVRMGTAPDAWNVILGAMAAVIPRSWWRNEAFSRFLAQFSWPMVALTDRFVGETHAIRVDVRGQDGSMESAIQAHDSFRVCVGQSCAEFVLFMLKAQGADGSTTDNKIHAGVYLPETLCGNDAALRSALLQNMTSTPGTFMYRCQGSKVNVTV